MGEIVGSDLTITMYGDASLVGLLLDQIAHPIATVLTVGEPFYRSILTQTARAKAINPPHATTVPSDTTASAHMQRDRYIQIITERGRIGGHWAVLYGRSSFGKVAFCRYMTLTGRSLLAWSSPAQELETVTGWKSMNIMSSFGMPVAGNVA